MIMTPGHTDLHFGEQVSWRGRVGVLLVDPPVRVDGLGVQGNAFKSVYLYMWG